VQIYQNKFFIFLFFKVDYQQRHIKITKEKHKKIFKIKKSKFLKTSDGTLPLLTEHTYYKF
jgi:hypothetical protein